MQDWSGQSASKKFPVKGRYDETHMKYSALYPYNVTIRVCMYAI